MADSAATGPRNPPKCPRNPKHPERTCWGCDQYCPANALACGNGTERTPHPAELFGEDWFEWAEANRKALEPDQDEEKPSTPP